VSGISLAEWLRDRADPDLESLLRSRPDLATPPPADTMVLATRVATRVSVARACDGLDALTLAVMDALVLLDADRDPVPMTSVTGLFGTAMPAEPLTEAVRRLRDRAIVWGGDDALSVLPAAREVAGAFPAGLGAASPDLDGADLTPLLAELPEAQRQVLAKLAKGPPIGRTREAAPAGPADRTDTPVRQLLGAGLLMRRDADTVELPRQVGLALRGAQPFGPLHATEPQLRTLPHKAETVDSVGAGEAQELCRHLEALLRLWSAEPAPVLRSGGLGVRELRKLARELDADERRAGLVVELAAGAGLVADTEATAPEWMPTTNADAWLEARIEQRWATVAAAWLDLPRLPGLAGQRDEKDRALAPLSEELRRPLARGDRRRILGALTNLSAGTGVGSPDELAAVLAWRAPRHGGRLRDDLVRWTLQEAGTLGIVALGAITSAGRDLLADGPAPAAKRMAAALPDPIDHVLVQADLTVVAPGPLEHELATEIGMVADVESAGGATVYRVGDASVRRALDAGRTAAELHELFATRSRTPVPQGLDYLIDDVARRHGRLRGGTAGSFLRCDDEVLLAEVLANPVAASLELRKIAPTVVISPLPLIEVLDSLREAGFTPAAEGPDGHVVDLRPPGRRTSPRPRQDRRPGTPQAPTDAQLAAVVRQLRVGDRAGGRRGNAVSPTPGTGMSDMAVTVAALSAAMRQRREVWVGVVDRSGVASQRLVAPVSVGGGVLEGIDHGSGEVRRFQLHRITSVELADQAD
jgi:hypothetical protein